MDANKLRVNNVRVTQTTTFDRNFQATPVKVVSYFVDHHGPFELRYSPPAAGTPEAIKADMDRQVLELRTLLAGVSAGE